MVSSGSHNFSQNNFTVSFNVRQCKSSLFIFKCCSNFACLTVECQNHFLKFLSMLISIRTTIIMYIDWGRISTFMVKFLSTQHYDAPLCSKLLSCLLCNLLPSSGFCIFTPEHVLIPCCYAMGFSSCISKCNGYVQHSPQPRV